MFPLNSIGLGSTTSPLVSVIISLTCFLFAKFLFKVVKRFFTLPNGPWGLPIFGYLPFLERHLYLQFDRMAKRWGPVFSLKLGKHDVAVVCDWPHMREAFANEALLARPHETFFNGIINVPSFTEMSGDPWREHRRLSLHILRDIGMGKSAIEELVAEEIATFLDTLDDDGKPVDFIRKLAPSVSNNVAILLFGRKFDYDDPEKLEIDNANDVVGREFQFAGIFTFLPWLVHIFIAMGKLKMDVIRKCVLTVDNFLKKEIKQHWEKSESSEEVSDYIDGYLQEMREKQKKKGKPISFDELERSDDHFSLEILRRNVSAFFGAGSETILSTMTWAVMYLVQTPEYQEKIRDEIASVIGFARRPEYSDRGLMPFTMAYLYEVQRMDSIVPTNLLRRAARDTKIGSYNIPKETLVLFNFWSVHHDPKLWVSPEKFDPSRFLSEDGSKAVKPPYLVPFSSGKRNCVGEGFANVEAFLYLVSIVQKYQVKKSPGTELSFEASFGISRRPAVLPPLIFEKLKH